MAIRFSAQVSRVGVKPRKREGLVVGADIEVVLTTDLDGDVLRSLGDAVPGSVLHVRIDRAQLSMDYCESDGVAESEDTDAAVGAGAER